MRRKQPRPRRKNYFFILYTILFINI